MGVWIETFRLSPNNRENSVTPCMGVWIETTNIKQESQATHRHTLYGCVD